MTHLSAGGFEGRSDGKKAASLEKRQVKNGSAPKRSRAKKGKPTSRKKSETESLRLIFDECCGHRYMITKPELDALLRKYALNDTGEPAATMSTKCAYFPPVRTSRSLIV
jgi:hypothetical protein